MGTIQSGIGLISGFDYETMIDQLIALDAAPRDRLLVRMSSIDAQRTAYLDISARISAILSHVGSLTKPSFFNSKLINSSDSSVLSVTGDSSAVPGSYSFVVKALATTHQLVSRGFQSTDSPLEPGSLTLESARARVNASTRLDALNGHRGVQRGTFELIDGDGNEAVVSIADAVTLADVVEAINAADVNVSASVQGDGLVLRETTGGSVRVREVDGHHVAQELGFGPGKTYDAGGRIVGNDLIYLGELSPLSALNDGNGIRRSAAGSDFSINGIDIDLSGLLEEGTQLARLNHGRGVELGSVRITTEGDDGHEIEHTVDLSGLQSVGQVIDVIEASVDGLSVTRADNHLVIGYSEGGSNRLLRVEDISGHAARDLGIDSESSAGKIKGDGVLHVESMIDVIAAINHANGNDGSVIASLGANGLVIDGGGSVTFEAAGDSQTLFDLGFTDQETYDGVANGRRIIGGIDSVLLNSLNGGAGFTPGTIRIQAGASQVSLDLNNAVTTRDVIEQINAVSEAEGLGIEADYDHTGMRLVVRSIDGTTPVSINDVAGSGTFAADLGFAGQGPAAELRSDNLQLQYVSEASLLDDLNHGRGVALGELQITNSLGQVRKLNLTEGSVESLQDVIDKINLDETFGVVARVNDTGDGLLLEDTNGGNFDLQIEDKSGTTARDLNIAGTFEDGVADGSYEINVEIGSSDTLEEVVARINDAGGLVSATILNDGTGVAPYRLQISSRISGLAGELLVDGMEFTTLSQAQDAKVVLGSDANSGIVMTSSSNTITNIVPGLTLDLNAVSDEAVTVTIERDTASVLETVNGLVSGFNEALGRIAGVSSYNPDTEARGVLLSESTVQQVQRRLFSMISTPLESPPGKYRRLSDLGFKIRDGEITLDQAKFQEALDSDPDAVAEFFSDSENGLAPLMKGKLEEITETGGMIDRRSESLERQKEVFGDRVDVLNERLDAKRERLLREFRAMESALAQMQSQQSALTQLATLASSLSSTTG